MQRNLPAGAAATELLVGERLAAARNEPGVPDTVQIEWRGEAKSLTVIKVPLANLLYNPDTHRVRAQRDFDPQRDQRITDDPWSDAAQSYLDYLLGALPNDPSKSDPSFDKLKDDLEAYGQKDPGIITPSGILINGNTRAAALRRLNQSQMRVAVLPSDWGWGDVSAVELELQMRRDYRRDYSFVNTLLALDEATKQSDPDTAMKAFRISRATFNQRIWILETLMSLVRRSETPEGISLNLRDFENDQGKLEELHRTYSATAKTDPEEAELLKESRLLALVVDKSKTDLRFVENNFVSEFLDRQLPSNLVLPTPAAPLPIPGINIALPSEPEPLLHVKSLVDVAARSRAVMNFGPESESKVAAIATYGDLSSAVEAALEDAGKSVRLKKRRQAAVDRVNDAADSLDSAIQDIADAKSKQALDETLLGEALVNLQNAFDRFAKSATRMLSDDVEGVAWLSRTHDSTEGE